MSSLLGWSMSRPSLAAMVFDAWPLSSGRRLVALVATKTDDGREGPAASLYWKFRPSEGRR